VPIAWGIASKRILYMKLRCSLSQTQQEKQKCPKK